MCQNFQKQGKFHIYSEIIYYLRSGKILRYTLKNLLDGDDFSMPATIEDPSVYPAIELKVLEAGYGKKKNSIN